MTFSFSLAQAKSFTLAENFSFRRGLTTNAVENQGKQHRSVSSTFDGHVAFKGFGTFFQNIEIPIDDPQDILDGNIPFNSLVLKPKSAAFDEELEGLAFIEQDTSKFVFVVFTDASIGAILPIDSPLPEDGPGMWVLIGEISDDPPQLEIEQAIRVTDGTNILIPVVRLAELTGVFGDVIIGGSPILPESETWSKCLPFARFTFSTVLALSQATHDALQPQLTEELPEGALVAIIE